MENIKKFKGNSYKDILDDITIIYYSKKIDKNLFF